MRILIYSFNDKIGDGLQKITFIQSLKKIYPKSHITYTTSNTTTLKTILNPLIEDCIDEFIENNHINSSFINLLKKNPNFKEKRYELIIDLQKVVIRSIKLKQIHHEKFFSASANFLFSDFKNEKVLSFKNIYIEKLYFNILSIISGFNFDKIPSIYIPKIETTNKIINTPVDKNIAIAPGAGDIIRQWDFDKYINVAKKLRQKGYEVYFFLGPEERGMLKTCIENKFTCPEWKNGKKISNDILFTMNLAKKMKCLLCNDGGTSWIFEFAGIKTLKIFGVTNEKKFARPNFSTTIQVKDYGFENLRDFPTKEYENILSEFLNKI
jgi:ADP-heptose:LPS heptosyltransferase